MTKRARGKAYSCICGAKLRMTLKGPDAASVDRRWGYLFCRCGGGVKLRWEGAKIVEVVQVEKEEADHVRSMPMLITGPRLYDRMMGAHSKEVRDKIEFAWDQAVKELKESATGWYRTGGWLLQIKDLLGHGNFGVFVDRKGLDRVNAHRFITFHQAIKALPSYSSTLKNLGPHKTLLVARLPQAKQIEILEEGALIEGRRQKAEDLTHRQLAKYVQSIVGKDPRGRKKTKPEKAERPKEQRGVPIEIADAFVAAIQALRVLHVRACRYCSSLTLSPEQISLKDLYDNTDKHAPLEESYAALKGEPAEVIEGWWLQIKDLFSWLDEELGMRELVAR